MACSSVSACVCAARRADTGPAADNRATIGSDFEIEDHAFILAKTSLLLLVKPFKFV